MTAIGLLVAAIAVAAFFAYIYNLKRQLYLKLWTWGWSFLALHYVSPALEPSVGVLPWLAPVNEWLQAFSALMFLWAAQIYVQSKGRAGRIAVTALGILGWSVGHYLGWIPIPASLGTGIILLGSAWIYWEENRKQETVADLFLAISFALWGTLTIALTFFEHTLLGRLSDLRIWPVVPELFIAMLMVMALYEEEKRRIERNMLALSNLNLATSSFIGGEIQRMLSQALDRVLGVVRIPAGALFLHHGDPYGPTSVVAVGLSDNFCSAAQEEGLDDHLVNLVARLGGLVVFRDLSRDSAWAALEKEEAFRRFRQLAIAQGLRTVVGISLQAKEQAFGVLLLGTPDSRRFTPAELRLIVALGHQIGMAVENSYLIQQTSRRSEELHVLNEIGRALSSTLNKEDLMRKVWEEMKRLFDVDNFYVARHEPFRDELLFELEATDGVRLPRRSRPLGNHLTEYLLRTRQPLLIRENLAAEVRRLGVEPIQEFGCFCGVPLVIHDLSIGVMVAHSKQERLFDEGHLELMRVLASEASIAIENARLFREEQTRGRHLTLLNNISRHAISTLNPDEMLAKIAEELEEGLSHDHIGIGLLDYATREIVVQAEAGLRRAVLEI